MTFKQICPVLLLAIAIAGCSSSDNTNADETQESGVVATKSDPIEEVATVPSDSAISLVAGTWIGKPEMSEEEQEKWRALFDDDETFEEMLEQTQTISSILEIFEDGTYTLTDEYRGGEFTDTWQLDGETLTLASSNLVFEEQGRVPDKEPMILSVEKDGTELVLDDKTEQSGTRRVFKKN